MPEDKLIRPVTAIPEPYRPAITIREIEPEENAAPLSHYLWILRRHRWKLLGLIATSVLVTLLVSFRITPIYASTSTIDVDRQMPTGVIGQDAMRSTTNDADQFLATQIKLIQSDSVLRPIDRKYHLRELEKDFLDARASAPPNPTTPRWCSAPGSLPPAQHLPAADQLPLHRTAARRRRGQRHRPILPGTHLQYPLPFRRRPFQLHGAPARRAEGQDGALSAALVQFERELNVINPEEKTSILSARLLQLNTEYTKAQAERVAKEALMAASRTDPWRRAGLGPG
jgi:hypothetical protein